jgi:hypothetical protein
LIEPAFLRGNNRTAVNGNDAMADQQTVIGALLGYYA